MVYILLGNGFEETEAVAPMDILRRGGVEAAFAGIGGRSIEGAHGVSILCDVSAEKIDLNSAEMLVIPGGLGGVKSVLGSAETMELLEKAAERGTALGAICAGPLVLHRIGALGGKRAVCYPGMEDEMPGAEFISAPVCTDGAIVTGRGPGAALDFGFELLKYLKSGEAVEELKKAMVCQ